MPLMPWEKRTTGCCSELSTNGAPCRHAMTLPQICPLLFIPAGLHAHVCEHASDCVA